MRESAQLVWSTTTPAFGIQLFRWAERVAVTALWPISHLSLQKSSRPRLVLSTLLWLRYLHPALVVHSSFPHVPQKTNAPISRQVQSRFRGLLPLPRSM